MTGAATDERRRRWSAYIDLQAGVTRLRAIDDDGRPSPRTSALLDAVRRPARPEPPRFEAQSEPVAESDLPTEGPAQPWARRVSPAAQPQDADRRAGTDVRIPAAAPDTAPPDSVDVVDRVRQTLGLPSDAPPVAPPFTESPLEYGQVNPAGAFVTSSREELPAAPTNPAGSFVSES